VRLSSEFTLLQVTPALDTGGVEQTTLDMAAAVVSDVGGRALVASSGGRLEDKLTDAGGELIRLPVQSKNPAVVALNALRLKSLIDREAVHLVHVRSRAPAFSALWAARRAGVPLVATYHGIYHAGSGLKRWYNGVMARGDLVIANSEFTRAHLIAQHKVDPENVVAIPRGLDLREFDPAAVAPKEVSRVRASWGLRNDPRPVILLAGRLTRWKGQAFLLEALSQLKSRGVDNFVVVMAGDDQGRTHYSHELTETIGRAGLADQVRLVGHCAEMPAAYLAADLVVAPSLEPEAFGRTGVEPQAMSRPVLAADHGAARETVREGQTGWLVAPGDPAAWARAIEEALAAGPSAWARMGAAGRAWVGDRYSVEAMTRATLDAYVLALSRSPLAAP
jgi:glycosyltransferase involved in cell wall biosynthesis